MVDYLVNNPTNTTTMVMVVPFAATAAWLWQISRPKRYGASLGGSKTLNSFTPVGTYMHPFYFYKFRASYITFPNFVR